MHCNSGPVACTGMGAFSDWSTFRIAGSDNIVFEKLDVTSPESVQQFAERLQQQHGGATILVNNAGGWDAMGCSSLQCQ